MSADAFTSHAAMTGFSASRTSMVGGCCTCTGPLRVISGHRDVTQTTSALARKPGTSWERWLRVAASGMIVSRSSELLRAAS